MVENLRFSNYDTEQFISIVSERLGVETLKEERIHTTKLSESKGQGYFKAYDFDHGITVYEIDCTLNKDLQLIFGKCAVQPLVILFNREEPIYHYFEKIEEKKSVEHLESFMLSADLKSSNTFILPGGQSTCFFAIFINRKEFEEKIEAFLQEMSSELVEIFRDVNGVNSFNTKGYFSLDIAKFIEEFTTTELTGFMRYVFLEGKLFEIVSHYLKQYLDDSRDPSKQKILRQRTVEKIEKASNIIENEMAMLGSIMSLAKRVGLNQNTLQEGFNQLYKKSVNQYIKEMRLEKAKDLMETTNLNVTEITYRIGINSRSYFSKLFKEKFGLTPKQYLHKVRKNRSIQSA